MPDKELHPRLPLKTNGPRASAPNLDQARKLIEDRADEWACVLQELVRTPSYFEAEHAIVRRICDRVTALGLVPILVPMDPLALQGHPDSSKPISAVAQRNNVVVRLPGRGRGRSLILNCHLDIQPAGDEREWSHPPFSGHIDAE